MLTKQIAQYLAANGIGTLDTDIFYEYVPSSPDGCVVITSTGGYESSNFMGYDDPTIQVRVRNTTPTAAINKINAVYNVLQGLKHTNLISGGIRVISVTALQAGPENIGKDAENRIEYTQNYRLDIRNQTTNRD